MSIQVKLLNDPSPSVRTQAIAARSGICGANSPLAEIVENIADKLGDPAWCVREAAMCALKQLGEVVTAAHNGALVKCQDCGAKRVTQTKGQRMNHVQTELSQAKEVVFRAEALLEPIMAKQEEGPLRIELDKQLDRARAQVSFLEEQGGICQHR